MYYSKIVRPSNVYGNQERVETALQGYKIQGFRPPRAGDFYLGQISLKIDQAISDNVTVGDEPRFIVAKVMPNLPEGWWE